MTDQGKTPVENDSPVQPFRNIRYANTSPAANEAFQVDVTYQPSGGGNPVTQPAYTAPQPAPPVAGGANTVITPPNQPIPASATVLALTVRWGPTGNLSHEIICPVGAPPDDIYLVMVQQGANHQDVVAFGRTGAVLGGKAAGTVFP